MDAYNELYNFLPLHKDLHVKLYLPTNMTVFKAGLFIQMHLNTLLNQWQTYSCVGLGPHYFG